MISICMATYNGQKYIRQQVDSICSQLSENDELIISDDYSTDETWDILQSYTDPRVKIIRNQLTKGVTHNFENAIKQAQGDIIFLSDQDDVWMPGKIAELSQFLIDGHYDVVTCNCAVTDANLTIIKDAYYTTESPIDRSVWGNFKKDLWLGCCMAFRRQILEDILPIPQKMAAHDLWIALYSQLHYRCGYYPKVLQYYRRHSDTVSFAGEKSPNSLWFKISYRVYLAWHLLLRSVKR